MENGAGVRQFYADCKDVIKRNLERYRLRLYDYELANRKVSEAIVESDIEPDMRAIYKRLGLALLGWYPDEVKYIKYRIKDLEGNLARINSKSDIDDKVDTARNVLMDTVLMSLSIETPTRGMIRCPFHDERTASCKVYADHLHCFGCGAHEDGIGTVMRVKDCTFLEAIDFLV